MFSCLWMIQMNMKKNEYSCFKEIINLHFEGISYRIKAIMLNEADLLNQILTKLIIIKRAFNSKTIYTGFGCIYKPTS